MSKPEELDVRGYRCPMPVLRAQRRLRELDPGAELIVIADDPIARVDFPHFCNQSGVRLIEMTAKGACFRFHLKKPDSA